MVEEVTRISPFTMLSKGSGHGKVAFPGADRISLDTHLYLVLDPSTPMAPIVTGSGIDAGEVAKNGA